MQDFVSSIHGILLSIIVCGQIPGHGHLEVEAKAGKSKRYTGWTHLH